MLFSFSPPAIATSFALQAEQPVRGNSIRSGDIRALCPELLGLYIAVDGVVESRGGDSKGTKQSKPVGDGPALSPNSLSLHVLPIRR